MCKFQLVSCVGSVTAWHSSSGRQPNFAALNRGRHLYSAGRPSSWALANILVIYDVVRQSESGIHSDRCTIIKVAHHNNVLQHFYYDLKINNIKFITSS